MGDFLQAFIDFLTDLFAALEEFLGGSFTYGDILGEIGGLIDNKENTDTDANA